MKKIYEQPTMDTLNFNTENILSSSGEILNEAFFGEEDPLVITQ